MSEMVERAAKAIFWLSPTRQQRGRSCEELWLEEMDGIKEFYRTAARAAIKAMFEPTKDMVLAGFDQLDLEASPHAAENCWRAMIDAALA